MTVRRFLLTQGEAHFGKECPAAHTSLPQHTFSGSRRNLALPSICAFMYVCASVANYLSSVVLDAKLVVGHSGLHIEWVRLRKKEKKDTTAI